MRYFKRQSAFILIGLFLVFGALVSGTVNAQVGRGSAHAEPDVDITIATEIIIPGSEVGMVNGFMRGKVGDLAGYLGIIYNFMISIVGVVAGVFILVGGFQYLTAGGDAARVSSAKNRIANALIGMVLALSSFVLLNTINPDLVNLKLPKLIKTRTVLSYLPFCDELAKQLGIEEENITNVGGTKCGAAGFYTPPNQQVVEEIGGVKGKTGRLWCVARGAHATGNDRFDDAQSDYGCFDGEVQDDGLINDTSFKSLSICLQKQGITAAELDEDFEENNGRLVKFSRIASCASCVGLSGFALSGFYNMEGDAGCQAWQNTANNGSPDDFSFSHSQKLANGIIQDTRKGRTSRMYYCGFSADKNTCVYTPLNCAKVRKCSDYSSTEGLFSEGNDFSLHYCKASVKGVSECHGSEKLGSKLFSDAGAPSHLLPICTGNPCDASGGAGAKCDVPGLAGYSDIPGANQVRLVGRVLTGGLAGDVECK